MLPRRSARNDRIWVSAEDMDKPVPEASRMHGVDSLWNLGKHPNTATNLDLSDLRAT